MAVFPRATTNDDPVLQEWRLRVLNIILAIAAGAGAPGLAVLLFDTARQPERGLIGLIFALIYLLIVVLAIFRRLDVRLRGWGLLLAGYTAGICDLAYTGLPGDGRTYLFAVPVLAIVLVGVRAGVIMAVLSIGGMAVFTGLAHFGILEQWLIQPDNPIVGWIESLATYGLLVPLITVLLLLLYRLQVKTLDAERKSRTELEEAHHLLEEHSGTLEQKVKQRTNELEIALQEAREATRLKSEFLATMSHELRTPLNSIIGYTDLLLQTTKESLPEKQHDYLNRILSGGERLLGLIDDVLDLSRIEAGQIELINEPFSPFALLTRLASQMQRLAEKKGLVLSTRVDASLPEEMIGDKMRLEQIVTNLMGNAIKFTETGRVEVCFERIDESRWEITVADTGIGIPAHALEYIFEEFRQVDGTTHRKYGGTGLGLAVVRKLAVLMGGAVSVQSEVGRGSTFKVSLPIVLSESHSEDTRARDEDQR